MITTPTLCDMIDLSCIMMSCYHNDAHKLTTVLQGEERVVGGEGLRDSDVQSGASDLSSVHCFIQIFLLFYTHTHTHTHTHRHTRSLSHTHTHIHTHTHTYRPSKSLSDTHTHTHTHTHR